jgi:hypothetical protein
VALVGACALSLSAVAFLLGRATAPEASHSSQLPSAQAEAARALPGASSADLAAGGAGADMSTATGGAATGGPLPGEVLPLDPLSPPTKGGAVDAAVAAYFAQMDALSAEAKASQDPQTVARTILDQAISGNMSGIDELIAKQRTLAVRLSQVQPPPACREHHERSVRLFARAIALLEKTRDAIGGQPADIAGAAVEGRAIEAEAKVLDALANDLRRSAGLPPAP